MSLTINGASLLGFDTIVGIFVLTRKLQKGAPPPGEEAKAPEYAQYKEKEEQIPALVTWKRCPLPHPEEQKEESVSD